jgi:hypothetical protein
MTPELLKLAEARIAQHLEEISLMFRGNYKFTFIAHELDRPDRNLLATNDPQLEAIVKPEFLNSISVAGSKRSDGGAA